MRVPSQALAAKVNRCTVHPDDGRFVVVCWACQSYLNDGKPVSLAAAAELADVHDAKHVEHERKSLWQSAGAA